MDADAGWLRVFLADIFSPIPKALDEPKTRGGDLSHPDFPRLLSLSHQGLQGT